jgi:hypothetical protein
MTFLKHQILLKNLHIIIILGKSIDNLHNLLQMTIGGSYENYAR